ncbi:hypothetical protein SYJ56_03990 [Algoriphagus sp. D3-2-R+10]|uniref:hypothetical protein n=1 Tax=Algoriphagus aurantiacus TaxID=3103948 RepID=UPI002B3B6F1B|nr:hypothetical protein [Algoriphagus sp. D3-2-R+10]MEB2774451.1 hypothetical protein [Algoriphagus sp. D3-2-R+10]
MAIAIFSILVIFVADASLENIYKKSYAMVRAQSLLNDPELIGPDGLCNIFGSVIGVFSGGGDSASDVYKWTIIAPDGTVLFTRPAGAFQTIEYAFEQIGAHTIKLEVSRAGKVIADFKKEVEVINGPIITLANNYKICVDQPLDLQAISPSSANFSNYIFEWKSENDEVVGSSNTLKVNTAGSYSVTFYVPDEDSNPVCETKLQTLVEILDAITIIKSSASVCSDGSITFTSDPPNQGQWLLTIPGEPTAIPKGNSSSLTLVPNIDLPTFGEYSIELILENIENPACRPQAISNFTYNQEPLISLVSSFGASGCFTPDGGLELIAETNLDQIIVGGVGTSYGPFLAGETISITNLESGGYTLYSYLNGCQNRLGAVVPLDIAPSILDFAIENITSESCTSIGKKNGSFDVNLINGPTEGSFRILSEKGDVVVKEALPSSVNPFKIELGGGKYFFEILDSDSCKLPTRELIEIPGKPQVIFTIPEQLTICESYDLIPQTTENLLFTLTDPSGNTISKNAGEPFTITAGGEYSLLGLLPNQSDVCPSELKLTVSTADPIPFDPVLISEDCVIGNRIFEADIYGIDQNLANFYWRNSIGDIIGTGQSLFLSPNSIGTFSLEVQPINSQNCPISPKEFTVEEPVLFVDASINSTKLCELGPEAILELITTSPEAVTNIRWRRFDEAGEIEELPEFNNQKIIMTRIGGTYEAAAYSIIPQINKDCELGRTTFQLDLTPDKVEFEIPDQLIICDFYELVPETSQDLEFFLTTPTGEVVEKSSGQSFKLEDAGIYTFLAFDRNSPTAFCPEQKELVVTLTDAVDFQPILSEEFCDGRKIYQASVSNYALEDVDISWSDKDGNEVASSEFITIDIPGIYTLEVQPSDATPCHITPITFEVLPPLLAIDVMLVADPLCPDSASASIRAEADFSLVTMIEWWYTSPTGEQSELVGERNKEEILAINEGTYEVRLLNQIQCNLGFDRVLLLRSTDIVRPEVEDTYQICPKYQIGPTINPGNFASYEWYFEDQLVSTNTVYKPVNIGDHRLIVYSEEGCAFQTDFATEEECELRVIYPNAVQLGNPDKQFLLYTNYLIDEVNLVILNQWGQVIFQCSQTNLISEETTCLWDGTYNGKVIPNGNYAVRINFKNYEKNISKSEFGSILIID